jgi:hypothetical protein
MTSRRQGMSERGAIAEEAQTDMQVEGAYSEEGHRGRMLSNHNYDLVQELGELLTGLWRIDDYLRDAGGNCDECGRIWQDVRKQKEFLIEKVRQEIVNHAKNGRFI